MFLTCLGVGGARIYQNCHTQRGGATLHEGSFSEGISHDMVQSEGGNEEVKSNKYDMLKLFHNTYSLRVLTRFGGTYRVKRKTNR